MRPVTIYAKLALAVGLLLLLLGLPACFDYEVKLKLEANGWGQIATRVVLPAGQAMTEMPKQLKSILDPKPTLKKESAAGKQIITETVRFKLLSHLKMNRLRFQVELLDIGLIYVGTPSYRFTAWLMPTGHDRDDRTVGLGLEMDRRATTQRTGDAMDSKVAKLYARSLAGRHFSLTVELPGKVTKARDWVVGGHRISPRISADRSSVTWQFPLAVLINEKVRANLIFTADFKGQFATKGTVASTIPTDVDPTKKKDQKGPGIPGKQTPGAFNPQRIGVTPRGRY